MKDVAPARQLAISLARFSPQVIKTAKLARAKVRARLPRAIEMVYDNYNALVIGYSPNERPSEAILSIALYPRWVNVYFLYGAHLPDPDGLLQGKGNQVRFIRLDAGAAVLDTLAFRALLREAVAFSGVPFDASHTLVIRAVSKKQRARR